MSNARAHSTSTEIGGDYNGGRKEGEGLITVLLQAL